MNTKIILPTASLIFIVLYLAVENMSHAVILNNTDDYFLVSAFILLCISAYDYLEVLGDKLSELMSRSHI